MNHEDVPKKELHWVHLVHLFVVPPSHKWSRSSAIVGCHQKASKRTCLVQINSTTLQPIHTQQKKTKCMKQSMRCVGGSRFIFFAICDPKTANFTGKFWLEDHERTSKLIIDRRCSKNSVPLAFRSCVSKIWCRALPGCHFNDVRKLGTLCLTQWKQYTPVSKRETIFGIWYQKHIWCSTKSILPVLSDLHAYRYVNPLATKLVKNSGFPIEDRPVTD